MKGIITVAGKGTRLRPHSFSKPKPFIPVGDTTPIEFIIKHMATLSLEEIIIVHDKFNEDFYKESLPRLFPQIRFKFAIQENQLGPVHAYLQAKEFITEGDDILIINCDTMFVHELSKSIERGKKYDGILFVKEVENYQRFGVALHNKNILTKCVEKPSEPISKLAHIGAYYFTDGKKFMDTIQILVDKGEKVKGEFYMPAFLTRMIEESMKIWVEEVEEWLDTGEIETTLKTNAWLLKGGIWKGENVIVENSDIQHNVSIGKNTVIKNCTIKNSIIGKNTVLEGMEIEDSIIGDNVILKKGGKQFNIGDNSTIQEE